MTESKIIDRSFKGVGRIKRATGTTIPKVVHAMSNMLTTLHQSGRLDLLRAIRDGKLSLLVVYDAWRRNALGSLPLVDTLQPLVDAMGKWIRATDASTKHRASLNTSLNHFKAADLKAIVGDLPALLEAMRDTLGKTTPSSFNKCRDAAQAFVRSTLKKSHPLYAAIRDVEEREVEPSRINHPARPKELAAIAAKMEQAWPGSGKMAWTLALTGMRPKEYWGDWQDTSDSIRIASAKQRQTRAVQRWVPRIEEPHRPTCWYGKFRALLSDASSGQMQPYDLRRTYANWAEDAKWATTNFRLYFGHGKRNSTDIYQWREVRPHLVPDAEKMRTWLKAELSTSAVHDSTHDAATKEVAPRKRKGA